MTKNLSHGLTAPLGLLISCLLGGCFTFGSQIQTLNEVSSTTVKGWSCDKAIVCPTDSNEGPHMCKIPLVNGASVGWGDSQCGAQKDLKQKLCKNKIDLKSVLRVSCTPDPSAGECPITPGFCTFEYSPSTCRAQEYNKATLAWNLQPIAWGSNSCMARIKLKERACYSGLLPSLLENISCEPDRSQGQCPPQYQCQSGDDNDPSTCTVSKFGNKTLTPPWSESAPTECEAKFAIYSRACSYANAENNLKPDQLGDIQCEDQ